MQKSNVGDEVQQGTVDRNVEQHTPKRRTRRHFLPDKTHKKNGHHTGLNKTPIQLQEEVKSAFKFTDNGCPKARQDHKDKGDYSSHHHGFLWCDVRVDERLINIDGENRSGRIEQ